MDLIRLLWALPISLPGALLGVMVRWTEGGTASCLKLGNMPVLLLHGPLCAKLLQRYPWLEVDALTIGCVIVARDESALRRCLSHELVHVEQGLRWGPLFPLAYCASSAWAWLRGRDAYGCNVFEQAARRAETTDNLG